jgi:nucleotide-binding universal stress UspA family protein
MKTILVPTDFSPIADNAINYAVEIAKLTKARLIFLHAYHMPIITSEVPVVLPTAEEIEEDCMADLNRTKEKILSESGIDLDITCVCKYGLAVDEIKDFEADNKIDLLVLGMRGAGFIGEKLIGSVTTSLMRKVKCPLLAIDERVKFKPLKKIALASDYKEIENINILDPLKELMRLFSSHLHVVNVVREKAELVPTTEEASVGVKLEHSLEDVEHSFHYAENNDVVEGINEYVTEHNIDLVVMIPRTHSVVTNVFKEPHTKRMAFHTKVPLLVLNEG